MRGIVSIKYRRKNLPAMAQQQTDVIVFFESRIQGRGLATERNSPPLPLLRCDRDGHWAAAAKLIRQSWTFDGKI